MDRAIEEKIERGETCRMFESDFIERFSRIHPATPFIAYLPLVGYLFYRIVARGDLGVLPVVGLVAGGVFLWSFMEYVLHRFVFHFVRDAAWTKRLHFLIHGVHHDYPDDADRLVMPLGASLPMAVLFYGLFAGLGGARIGEPFFIGFVLGYLAYDGTHYAVHHFRQTTKAGKFLKKHHMMHHHLDHAGGFGVSSPLWDVVFSTMPRRIVKKSEKNSA